MTDKEINRRALAHGRNALRARDADAMIGCGWSGWDRAGLYPVHVGLGADSEAMDLACVMYAQMNEEAKG